MTEQETAKPPQNRRLSKIAGPAVILLAAAIAVAPQLMRGNSCGHDFDFHLGSWMDALDSWRHGIVYPHWAASPNFGAGEPRFVFYPPLTWMLGAALGWLLPWQAVPIVLTFLLLAGAGLATRALARQALEEGAATLAGCSALLSGYSLFTAYERSAFGELAGGLWIPLLLLFALRQRDPSASTCKRAFDGSAFPLALVVSGCWLSNVPLAVMACYLLAAVALAAALLAKSWAPVVRAALGAVLGSALAGLYLIPATWEQRWVDIHEAVGDPGELIENSWLFARHADPALAGHDEVLHRASLIATVMIAVALAALLAAWLRGRLPARRGWWIPLALIPPAILFLLLPVSLPLWNLLPKLRFLQFPWRWLVTLEAPMAIFFSAAVWPAPSARRRWRIAVAAACTVAFLALAAKTAAAFFQPCDEQDAVAARLAVHRLGVGEAGNDEFEPPGTDTEMIPIGLPGACLVADPATVLGVAPSGYSGDDPVPVWNAAQGSCRATYACAAIRPGGSG